MVVNESENADEPGETLKEGICRDFFLIDDEIAPERKHPHLLSFHANYNKTEKLRSGSYGTVFVVKPKHPSHCQLSTYAVKEIKRDTASAALFKKVSPSSSLSVKDAKQLDKAKKEEEAVYREVKILHDLSGLNGITQVVDFYIQPESFFVVQIFAAGGDVFDRLAKRHSYTEKDMRDLTVPLLETMKFMHDRKIVHRDMKPENLLLRERDKDSTVLVADFGFATYLPENGEGCKTRCGTPAFVAPEILMGKKYESKVDMWSLGCILYMLLSGYPPFYDRSHKGIFRKIKAGDYVYHTKVFADVSVQVKQLISSFLIVDPLYRNTAANALKGSTWVAMKSSQLSTNSLTGTLQEMKKLVAKRRFKSAMHATVFTVRASHQFKVHNDADFLKQQKEWDAADLENFQKEKRKRLKERQEKIKQTKEVISKIEQDHEEEDTPLLCQINKERFNTVYEMHDKINEGSVATVYECSNRKTNERYAVKIIERESSDVNKKKGNYMKEEAVLQEVAVMQNLDHKHIVKLIDFFEEEDQYYLVIDLLRGGDVFDRIIDIEQYTEKDARDLAKVLLKAIQYLHEKGIAHRDLKPQNLLLSSAEDDSDIRIADFGHACRVHAPQSITTRCGTPTYVAPEVLKNIPYDESCDLWSIGIILYIMLCGYPPFMEDTQAELFMKIRSGDYEFLSSDWDHVSVDAKDLIKGLMQVNPLKRLTAKQALKSKWIHEDDALLSNRSLGKSMQLIQGLQGSQRSSKFKSIANVVVTLGRLTKSLRECNSEKVVFAGMIEEN